jgi:hypothetical protein
MELCSEILEISSESFLMFMIREPTNFLCVGNSEEDTGPAVEEVAEEVVAAEEVAEEDAAEEVAEEDAVEEVAEEDAEDGGFHLAKAARDAAAFRVLLLRVVFGPGRCVGAMKLVPNSRECEVTYKSIFNVLPCCLNWCLASEVSVLINQDPAGGPL